MKTLSLRLIWIAALALGVAAQAQNFPYPQNRIYPYGIMPAGRNAANAQSAYRNWKARFVTTQGAGVYRRVLFDDNSSTVSEGIGYGMLLAVSYNERALFDSLWGYYNIGNHLNVHNLMHWKIAANGAPSGLNSATDAEEDVAFALVLASRQWGGAPYWRSTSTYLQDAQALIGRIYQYEVEAGTSVLKPGDMWGGSDITNISYYAPAYYRVFKIITDDVRWDQVINKCYDIISKAADPITGLVPDWCDANGAVVPGYGHDYTYDACRTPWRIALDRVWFGTKPGYAFCKKITGFANGVVSSGDSIVDGYKLTGQKIGQWHNHAFVSTFASGSLATDAAYQNYCNTSYLDLLNRPGNTYFNASWKALAQFLQTGNFNHMTITLPLDNLAVNGPDTLFYEATNSITASATASVIVNSGGVMTFKAGATISLKPGFQAKTGSRFRAFIDASVTSNAEPATMERSLAVNKTIEETAAHLTTPVEYKLEANYPNPFNPATTISYSVPEEMRVSLKVYNMAGQEVATLAEGRHEPGVYTATFEASRLTSGTYFAVLQAGMARQVKMMTLVK